MWHCSMFIVDIGIGSRSMCCLDCYSNIWYWDFLPPFVKVVPISNLVQPIDGENARVWNQHAQSNLTIYASCQQYSSPWFLNPIFPFIRILFVATVGSSNVVTRCPPYISTCQQSLTTINMSISIWSKGVQILSWNLWQSALKYSYFL